MKYLLRRLLLALFVLWLIATITFFLMHIIPGRPFTGEKRLPEAVERNLVQRYRLDDPPLRQYGAFMTNLLRGDLGPSYKYPAKSVNQIIGESFPVSATVGGLALLLACGVGVPLGTLAAVGVGGKGDRMLLLATSLGVSLPTFVLAPALVYIISLRYRLLPPALWGGPTHLVLPVLSLAVYPLALVVRLVRASLLEILPQPYLVMARAKGLSPGVVLMRHALPNALVPVLAYSGPLVAGVLTGSFIVERVFALPGLGEHFVTSIYNRDYGIIMGVTVFYSVVLVTLNLLADLICARLHPGFSLHYPGGDRK